MWEIRVRYRVNVMFMVDTPIFADRISHTVSWMHVHSPKPVVAVPNVNTCTNRYIAAYSSIAADIFMPKGK